MTDTISPEIEQQARAYMRELRHEREIRRQFTQYRSATSITALRAQMAATTNKWQKLLEKLGAANLLAGDVMRELGIDEILPGEF